MYHYLHVLLAVQYRSCIRLEISRTQTFGKKAVSHGQYFEQHLKYIVLNEKPYDFLSADLSYLLEVCTCTCSVCVCIGVYMYVRACTCICKIVYHVPRTNMYQTVP